MSSSRTITFFGASTGVGLATLKKSLAQGHTCIALLRTPSKLDSHFPPSSRPSNLIIHQGDAHDEAAVTSCLTVPGTHPPRLVDVIFTSIGAVPVKMGFSVSDPDVCKKGMKCLLESLTNLRSQGAVGSPRIVAISTISHSRHGRDIAIPMIPIYKLFVSVPAADKQVMEDLLVASSERDWVVVRPSHLVDGERSEREIRVGVEDIEKGVEKLEIGYSISREDVGRWCFEELMKVKEVKQEYRNKAVSLTW
ncbi:NAD(P)H-binding domain-containing protein [Sarocladium implicatum]|nr:NAD(P)H-binding domain-containing protein [Sarocladium implicatum]